MSTQTRRTRPKLERDQPIRRFDAAFGGGAAEDASAPADEPRSVDGVSRAVDLGYRVVDEYIKQGQRAARRMSDGSATPDAIAGDLQQIGTRMMQFAEQWMSLWAELARGMSGVPMSNGETRVPAPDPRATEARDAAGPPSAVTRVRIDVAATGPHEVSLDMRPAAAASSLILHALRAADPDLPRIDDLDFTPASDGVPAVLKIRIPESQPPGTYSGVIIDEATHRPVGTLSVNVPTR